MNTKNTDFRRILLVAALFAASAACLRLGTRAQENWGKLPAGFNQDLPPRLSPASLLGALGGMRSPAADVKYIDTLQYTGNDFNRNDGAFSQAYAFYREVLWLDPYFHFAVLEGSSFLVWFVYRFDEGRRLMEEAMRVDPKFYRYRMYYAAMAYRERGADHLGMLEFLKQEVDKPDTPEMLLRSVGNIMTRYGRRDEAIRYWSQLLDRATEKQTIDRANHELEILMKRPATK